MLPIDRIVLNNLYSLYESVCASSKDVEMVSTSGYSIIKTANSAWPNMVYRLNSSRISEGLIDEMVGDILRLNVKPLVLVADSELVVSAFRKKGFLPVDYWYGMYLDIEPLEIDNDLQKSAGLNISVVQDFAKIMEWSALVSRSLFNSKEIRTDIFSNLSRSKNHLIAANLDSVMVGSSLIHLDRDEIGGIYMVCVENDYRGRGIGKAMIEYALRFIAAHQSRRCVLQSTRLGYPLYESCGFKKLGRYDLFLKIK